MNYNTNFDSNGFQLALFIGNEATTDKLISFQIDANTLKEKVIQLENFSSLGLANQNQYLLTHTLTFVMHMMNTMAMIVFATKLSICPKALKLFVHNVGPLPYQYVFA